MKSVTIAESEDGTFEISQNDTENSEEDAAENGEQSETKTAKSLDDALNMVRDMFGESDDTLEKMFNSVEEAPIKKPKPNLNETAIGQAA